MILLLAMRVFADPECTSEPGQAVDPNVVAECGACHSSQADAFAGTHALLVDCAGCHAEVAEAPGAGHRSLPACADCHSEVKHHAPCTTCHDPHGTGSNAWLVREVIDGAPIRVRGPYGEHPDGLVHDGAGVCEVCHTATLHYRADQTGLPHETSWCGACHGHDDGFAPP